MESQIAIAQLLGPAAGRGCEGELAAYASGSGRGARSRITNTAFRLKDSLTACRRDLILTAIIDCGSKLTELCKFCIRFRPADELFFDRFCDQGQSWEVGIVETVSPGSFPDALDRV